MTRHHRTSSRTTFNRRSWRIAIITLVLALGLPLVIALYAQHRQPTQWGWAEWASLTISMLLGSLFFALTLVLGSDGEKRAQAVANSTLITSVGALQMSSARSFAGADHHALRIAADSRAALQHYANANNQEQELLLTNIEDAYSDLVFGTFSRAASLPRSIWVQLEQGATDLMQDAAKLANGLPRRSVGPVRGLRAMADNVAFALSIGREIRNQYRLKESSDGARLLECQWNGATTELPSNGTDSANDNAMERKKRLQCLYRRELTVKCQWQVLLAHSEKISCSVVINDITTTGGWYAPWYLTNRSGTIHPVSVLFNELNEPARNDVIRQMGSADLYPHSIRHDCIPAGLRTEALKNHYELLKNGENKVICVLTYDVIGCNGQIRRLVLDGNHRLAAARRLYNDRCTQRPPRIDKATTSNEFQVLTFAISELEPVDDTVFEPESGLPQWRGFAPDIGLIRGTWLADSYVGTNSNQCRDREL